MQDAPLPAVPMPEFALIPGEPLAGGLKRLTIEQLEHALEGFRHGSNRDVAVHEMRKATKRVRAVLRMVRPVIGEKVYRHENAVLRDAAGQMSAVRDGAVMVHAVAGLRDRYGRLLAEGVFAGAEARLRDRAQRMARRVLEDDEVLEQVVRTLLRARARYAAWPVDPDDPRLRPIPNRFQAIRAGLAATYRRGQAEMNLAYTHRQAEDFHAWRKRVKYLRHQMEVISPIWWEVIGGLARSLEQLGDVLGEEHDLAELTRLTAILPDLVPDPDERSLLVALAHHRRLELQGAARVMGSRIYAESSTQFVGRLGAYWNASLPDG